MVFIDAHVHLDFYDNMVSEIESCFNNNIMAIFVTHLPELFEKYSKYIKNDLLKLALGFHPILSEEYEFNKSLFNKLIKVTNHVGEVGLDYSVTKSEIVRKKQREIFDYICAYSGSKKMLSIHVRQAENDLLKILDNNGIKKAIFHWYTGKQDYIDTILSCGYYFSVNPAMLRSTKGKSILNLIPINRVLIETDGPFTKYDNHIIKSNDIESIYHEFGSFYNINNMKNVVFNNYNTITMIN